MRYGMGLLRKFLALTGAKRLLLLRAFALMWTLRLALWLMPYRFVKKRVAQASRRRGTDTRLSPDDPVRLDSELCNGCGFCTFVCPYGVIEVSPVDRKAVRCDLCRDRTEAGQPPACVAACPTKALRFEELSEDIRRRRREDAERVAANDARYVQERKGEAKKVVCEICGDAFMPWKLLERLRSQVPASVPVPNVCPVCRRKEVARLLAQHLIASTGPGR